MITLSCDKCEKTFHVEDDTAGTKVSCPHCGDVNRVPVPPPAAPQPRQPDRPPKGPADPAGLEGEKQLLVVRPAMFRGHPFLYTLVVLLMLGGIVLSVAALSRQELATMPWLTWVGVAMGVLAALWWLVWWAAPHRWTKLTVTTKRTIRQEGIVMRKTSEVLHNHIRNVKIEQSFLQRILGVGSIWIDSAGGSEDELIEIEMHHVVDPYGVKDLIDRHRRM